VNAIHALSQLSYAPAIYFPALVRHRGKRGNVVRAAKSVNEDTWPHSGRSRRIEGYFVAMSNKEIPDPQPDDLTIADILAQSTPEKPRRTRKRATAKNIGVYDADRDILDQYLFEVSQTPLLTPQQEMAIARLVQAGDPDAMQELIKRNLRFVISVAKKYQNRGLGLSDLIGEGNLGLLTAARKFDPDQGVKFISYAVWWIRQSILAALARQGRTVRVPLNRTADLSRITRTAETLRQDLRREPTPEEIAEQTGLAVDVVRSLAALNTTEVRLDAPLEAEGERSVIERFIADEQGDPEEQAMERFLSEQIDTALRSLAPRDAKVLRLYFGLDGGREHTLEEIGGMLGVTRERVRQLRDRALKRLREGEVGRALASFAA
jgi:RNA polymerase primary sigma factor